MTSQEIQSIFQNKFDKSVWQSVLQNVFGATELRLTPERLDTSTDSETGYYLGKTSMIDGLELGLFYYTIVAGSVAHKRVGLRNLVKTFTNPRYGVFDAALAVFDDGDAWRVSFISDIKGEATAPKRYTFVFGDAASGYRTAVERFTKLQQDGISLKSLLDAFSVETLTKEFYAELFAWYQWALSDEIGVTFPNDTSTEADDRIVQEHLIRLITRLMFVWFIKQKHFPTRHCGLDPQSPIQSPVPDEIFDTTKLAEILNDFNANDCNSGNYYNAILQNLFFATLNRPINERAFAIEGGGKGNEHYGIKTLYRDALEGTYFKKSHSEIVELFKSVPFLNGGLFECLGKEAPTVIAGNDPQSPANSGKIFYYDGFSRAKGRQKRAFVPNILFFEPDKGLISILKRYNFTIEENKPARCGSCPRPRTAWQSV
jgi:hypothetical protein